MILAFTNQTSDLGDARVGQLVDEVTNDVVLFLIGLESGAKFLLANQKEFFRDVVQTINSNISSLSFPPCESIERQFFPSSSF